MFLLKKIVLKISYSPLKPDDLNIEQIINNIAYYQHFCFQKTTYNFKKSNSLT